MTRLLIVLIVLLLIALIVMALLRRVARTADDTGAHARYRVLEVLGDGEAHVLIGRGSPDSNVLIGSIPVGDADFDEHYAELVVRAEDRAATLNASRERHESF